MPDPLTTVADEFAPTPLNIFDPKLAESVISRHGNAKRGLQTSSLLAKTVSDAANAEAAKRREERDALLATREEQEYAEKQEADAMRGDIIADMYENLRPTEEGYDQRVTEFLGQAPPSITKDPVFNEVLRGLTRRADIVEEERRKEREVEDRQRNTIEAIRERAKYGETMKFLTEEDIAKLPKDEMGNPDMFAAGMLAGQRKREAGIEDFGKKTDIRKKATIDILNTKNMDAQQRDLYDETKNILINDRNAFPSRVEMVLAKAAAAKKPTDPSMLKKLPEWGAELAKAEAWDKDLFENEVLAAQEARTPEEYVNLMGDISPTARQRRQRVWEYAHQNDEAAPAIPLGGGSIEDIRTLDGKAAPAGSKAIPLGGTPTTTAPAPATPVPTRTVVSEVQHPKGYIIRKYSDGKTVKVMPK
jgi:hypothetical protein